MNTKKAFTLIELLVVIAIIGILATISVIALQNARAKARDARRISDVKQVQTALELFFNDKGRYPTAAEFNSGSLFSTSTNGTTTYMTSLPAAPNPPDGNCIANQNVFNYAPALNGASYTIGYCLGNTVGSLTSGEKCATPAGMLNENCCGGNINYSGQSYRTVQIGSQCWMKDNLNIGTRIDSTNIAPCVDVSGTGSGWWSCQVNNSAVEKYCYDNDPNNCSTGGGLYEWAEALQIPHDCNNAPSTDNGDGTYTVNCPSGSQTISAKQRGICPAGWHMPSDADWYTMENYLTTPGNTCDPNRYSAWSCEDAGTKLMASGSSGFEAVLSGYRRAIGTFVRKDTYSLLWTSSILNGMGAYDRDLVATHSQVWRSSDIAYCLSVRCLKD